MSTIDTLTAKTDSAADSGDVDYQKTITATTGSNITLVLGNGTVEVKRNETRGRMSVGALTLLSNIYEADMHTFISASIKT